MNVTNPIPEYTIVAPKEAIISWKKDPITRQILELVSMERMKSCVRVGEGETLGDDIVQSTARAVGYIEGLEFLENLVDTKFVVENTEDDE
jgi:hypothetical protein